MTISGQPCQSTPGGEPRRDISAEAVQAECLKGRDSGAYCLAGKRVTGTLDLSGQVIERPLRIRDCEFAGPINLEGARACAGIQLEDCDICSVSADRLSVDGDLVLERVHSRSGSISLRGARLTGHLRCTGSQLSLPGERVFIGRGMMVGASALFDGGFRSEGEFILANAQIGVSVDMTGASFTNQNGIALMAEGIQVGADLLLSAGFCAEGSVVLREARVIGKLKCTNGHFRASPAGGAALDGQFVKAEEIWLDGDFAADGAVCLDGGVVSSRLGCNGGQFRNQGGTALTANGLECQDVRLGQGFAATGAVELIGAIVGRELNCTNGRFSNEGGTAIAADGLICDGKVYLNEKFEADGEIQLRNARVKTELNCTGGTFRNEGRAALSAEGLVCDGKVYLNEKFEADGEVQLNNARVKTELNCSGGTFRNEGRAALSAGGLVCEGDVYLNETFLAVGRVELIDVTIGRQLNCKGASFEIFRANRMKVGTTFDWQPRRTPQLVNVSFADVSLLLDTPDSWPSVSGSAAEKTQLVGFMFRDLGDERAWPSRDKDRIRLRTDWLWNASYDPGLYRQLARIYDQKGTGGAREISVNGQRDRRRRGGLSLGAKWWSQFLDYAVRYGYALHRPLLIALAAGIVGTGLFYLAGYHHLMVAVGGADGAAKNPSNCTSAYPCFFPAAYSFEILLPVVNLRQVSFWLPNASSGWEGKLLFLWVWLAIVYGWVVSIAIAAGIGHLFSQRD